MSTCLKLERAHYRDLNKIESIIKDAYEPIKQILSRSPGVLLDTRNKLENSLQNNCLYKISHQKNGVIGTLSLIRINPYTIKIYHFAIEPQFQNKGIGTWSFEEIMKMIISQYPHISTIELEIYHRTPRLLKFYQKFGFSLSREKEIRGERILILSKLVA